MWLHMLRSVLEGRAGRGPAATTMDDVISAGDEGAARRRSGAPTSTPKIAYVLGEYPLVSLTFIQREIAALRDLGLEVTTCAMRRTDPGQHRGPAEKAAATETFHVIEAMKRPAVFLAAQAAALGRPSRYFATLRLALAIRSPGLRALVYQLIYFFEATVLARHLATRGATHMHAHFTTNAATVAMLASELTAIPFSFTLHGPADLLEPVRWKIGEKAARARFVATISHYARSQLMFHTDPGHWDRLHIVHCGVEPERYAGEVATAPGETRAIFVGRIAPVKGLSLLIEAMTRLQEALPDLTLTIVGDGPDRAAIEAAAAPLGNRVRFTGYLSQEEVARDLAAADFAVLPSFAEGVPVFLMEALASGKPVVATQVAGVGELVAPGVHGVLVPPGDVESLTEAIRTLAGDPAARAAMGQAGRRKVVAEFDIATEAARLAALFSDLAPQPVRPDPAGTFSLQPSLPAFPGKGKS